MLLILGLWAIHFSYIDLRYRIIRNREVSALAILTLCIAHSRIDILVIFGFAAIFITFALATSAIGMGDAKLFCALSPLASKYGSVISWQLWCWVLGGICALLLRALSREKVKSIPFAPFIFAALFLAIWTN